MSEKMDGRVSRLALGGFLAFLVLLIAGTPASAQSVCEAYPNLPECQGDEGPGGGGDESDDRPAGVGGDRVGGTADLGDGAGDLPFTGYPVTPLVLIVLVLLATAALLRSYLAIRARVQARADGAGY